MRGMEMTATRFGHGDGESRTGLLTIGRYGLNKGWAEKERKRVYVAEAFLRVGSQSSNLARYIITPSFTFSINIVGVADIRIVIE